MITQPNKFGSREPYLYLLVVCGCLAQIQPTTALPFLYNNIINQQTLTSGNHQYLPHSQALPVPPSPPSSNSHLPPNGAILHALSQLATQQAGNQQALANQTSALVAPQADGQPANTNQYVIKWIHNDPKNHMAYVSISPVNQTNLYEPRIELRYQSKHPYVSLDERTPNNTVVAAVVVNDEDSGPSGETSLSIERGNELGHFRLVSTTFTNTIQVAGAPLSRDLKSEYNLTIVARDHGTPPKSSSSNLVIKLSPSSAPNSYQSNSPLEARTSLKPPASDLMYVGAMLVVLFSAVIFFIIVGCALVRRPKNKLMNKNGSVIIVPQPSRATSTINSRMFPSECSAHCLGFPNMHV